MASIWAVTYGIAGTGFTAGHSYLVKDEDGLFYTTDDQIIIRGGPTTPGATPSWGPMIVENGWSSFASSDGFDNSFDTDGDGYAEWDKNQTEIKMT